VIEKVEAFFTRREAGEESFAPETDAELDAAPAAWG
jgi:hypothetical protein